jgi:hypothetical protein
LSPHCWFYKQGVELCVAVRPSQNRSESDNRLGSLRNIHLPGFQLTHRNRDGIGIRQYGIAVARVGERSASLQRFKRSRSEGKAQRINMESSIALA